MDAEQLKAMESMGFPTSFGGAKKVVNTKPIQSIHQQYENSQNSALKRTTPDEPNYDSDDNEHKKQKTVQSEEEEDETINEKEKDKEDSSSDSESEDETYSKLPVSHEVTLSGHNKAVISLAIDPSGSRLISGALDYEVKLWDFAGMSSTFSSFRSFEAHEGQPVRCITYSKTGDKFVVTTGAATPKLYDRDATLIFEGIKGDMYLNDMTHTKGHVASCTGASFDPKDKNLFVTCGLDATLRIWNIEKKKQIQVIKTKNRRGQKAAIQFCLYSNKGRYLAAGCDDGSVQIFENGGPGNRPKIHIKQAHEPGSIITSLVFSKNDKTLISRATDDTVKIWNLKKVNSGPSLVLQENIETHYETQNVAFSPQEDLIIVPISAKKQKKKDNSKPIGYLKIFAAETGKKISEIEVKGSAVQVLWNSSINQIIYSNSEGQIHVLYDPTLSTKGAMFGIARKPRKQHPYELSVAPAIHTPLALPMFTKETKRQQKKRETREPIKSYNKEEMLESGHKGHHGNLGSSANAYMQKFITQAEVLDEDPREALLKYANEAEADPYWFKAYGAVDDKWKFSEAKDSDEE